LQVLRLAPAASTLAVIAAPIAVSTREPSQERVLRANLRRTIMAITLGTFTKFDNGAFTGTLKTLHVTAPVSIVPVDKMSDVKLEQPAEDGATHIALWEPRDQ
jgi:hypothetical protein